ncbi:CBS domain-containing protein, partial [Pontibacterium sp.]|uniref:CBS domain-containing protein n=1 Tax=Pontibacterium sp. TaxID=2036026 RepID=UPI00356482F3
MTTHAQDIMSRELFTVSPEMSLIDMDKALSSRKISGAPVVSNGELIGIVTSTDIGRRFSSNLKTEAGETSYYWHSNGTMTNLIVGSETAAGDLDPRRLPAVGRGLRRVGDAHRHPRLAPEHQVRLPAGRAR